MYKLYDVQEYSGITVRVRPVIVPSMGCRFHRTSGPPVAMRRPSKTSRSPAGYESKHELRSGWQAAGNVYLRAGTRTSAMVCMFVVVLRALLSFLPISPVTVNGGARSTKGGTASRTVGLSWQRAVRAISCRGLSVRAHSLGHLVANTRSFSLSLMAAPIATFFLGCYNYHFGQVYTNETNIRSKGRRRRCCI